MIVDIDQAEAPPLAEPYDVAIVGAGVAGIVLATSLAERGRRVLLLEAGGLDYSEESQSLYQGQNVGRDYFDLDSSRLRFLGGTSNHWAGWCRPLDPYDFTGHPHLPGSHWPIDIADVQPYLSVARQILEIDDFPPESAVPPTNDYMKEIFFRFSPPVRFKDKYLGALEASKTIDLYLNANVIKIDLDPASNRIAALSFRGYRDAAPLQTITADTYVLAMGGIENPRFLLNANHQIVTGLGNETDLVGRFFMEHPHHIIGYYVTTAAATELGKDFKFFSPTAAMIDQEEIANCALRIEPVIDEYDREPIARVKDLTKRALCVSDIVADFLRSVRYFRCPVPLDAGIVRATSEQVANPSSRVQLSDETDRFGQRRVALAWQLSPVDKRTMRAVGMAAGRYFAERDLARVKLLDWVLAEDDVVPGRHEMEELGGYHHMGTTRMGFTKEDGVVDRNCRVFGIDNLYVAGSSVFRTGGHANPTLTIVQLTLRLADHLSTL